MGKICLFPVEDEANTVKAILKLFGRNEDLFEDDVKTVENWMKRQPHLPEILDKDRIANFLTLNKCSVEKTKQKIDMYYTLRSLIPDIYENANPELQNMKKTMDVIYWTPLPKLTKDMYRVFVHKIRDKSHLNEIEIHDILALFFNIYEIRLKEDHILGDVVIVDLDGIPVNYALKVTPTIIAKSVAIYEKVYSLPLKAMYVINGDSVLNLIMEILKLVLKPKIFQRIEMCKDISILKERLSLDILPTDYGGNAVSCEEVQESVKLKFVEYKDRFDKLDQMRVDENLRPQKLENDDVLGFYGNFKKLSVD